MSENSTHESDAGDGAQPGTIAEGVLKKGDTLGRYLVLEPLGAGAMGVVYAAYDPELDRKIAVKILRPQAGKGDRTRRRERLVREAKAMAKLSHPNVGAIYDVGVHGDQVFLAMEFLSGGTLRDWLKAKKRAWREIVKMFIEVGKGLAGAHAEGLIHRDFKPDNVLLDKNGVPKVVDFGLVRLTSGALDRSTTGSMDAIADDAGELDEAASLPIAQTALAALTRTGAIAGTPAYMAPEQFLGKDIDARTDQFAFCIALYEALYGERPFAGETMISLAESVTEGRISAPRKASEVPSWVRKAILIGLQTKPDSRYPEISRLLHVLSNDPAIRRKRQLAAVLAIATLLPGGLYLRHQWIVRRSQVEDAIRRHLADAETAFNDGLRNAEQGDALRRKAFDLFEGVDWKGAEAQWQDARALESKADRLYQSAQTSTEAARSLDGSGRAKAFLAKVLVQRARLAELQWHLAERDALLSRAHDQDSRLASESTSTVRLTVHTTPENADVFMETFVRTPAGPRTAEARRHLGRTPLVGVPVPQGSHRLLISSDHHSSVVYPFLAEGSAPVSFTIALVAPSAVPAGFIYIPAGNFLFGTKDEELRTGFLEAAPIHQSTTQSFFIAKNETTIGEWIEFLDHLTPSERLRRLPKGREIGGASLELVPSPTASWELAFQPFSHPSRAAMGSPFVYPGRSRLTKQNWLRFPVTAISADDATAYIKWFGGRAGMKNARLCSEREWERAARGADDREFPSGDILQPSDANVDITYGRNFDLFGLDEIGSHPSSRSPFGLDDLAGNAFEFAVSATDPKEIVMRGGCYYQTSTTARSTNRALAARGTRAPSVGFRICADVS